MASMFMIGISIAFLSSLICLYLNKKQQHDLLEHFHLRRRTSTPNLLDPLCPKKKSNSVTAVDYSAIFPPSRRDALRELVSALPRVKAVDDATFKSSIVAFDADYRTCNENMFTPTGISVAEVKALGDFPDYAQLSGVLLPQPYKQFDIEKALARPYRPFRWPYHQTMSLAKMETDWWIELENTYKDRVFQRMEIFAKNGNLVLDHLPGSELACKELMEMVIQFLCARYPQYFRLSADKTVFFNDILGTVTRLKLTHPLHVLLQNVPEDFAITLRNPETGKYHFRAGVICSALGWNIQTKLGKELAEIHAPIPDYKEKMQFSMDRYFAKKHTDRPIQRGSWGLEVDQPLFMPPGDPHELYRLSQDASIDVARIHLRVDWQTLRRIPLSGAIVFNYKALFTPITEFRDEAYIPALVNKLVAEGKKNIMKYKNVWHVEHVAVPLLKEYEREQAEKGATEQEWTVHTLKESPWFPGWQEKWHRQQGF